MKIYVVLASVAALASSKNLKIDQIEYDFCCEYKSLKLFFLNMVHTLFTEKRMESKRLKQKIASSYLSLYFLFVAGAAQPGTIDKIDVQPFPIQVLFL